MRGVKKHMHVKTKCPPLLLSLTGILALPLQYRPSPLLIHRGHPGDSCPRLAARHEAYAGYLRPGLRIESLARAARTSRTLFKLRIWYSASSSESFNWHALVIRKQELLLSMGFLKTACTYSKNLS